MSQPTEFERFTRGEPINEEMRELRDDPNFAAKQQQASVLEMPRSQPLEDVERDLDRSEDLALKELRMSPGWPVLKRLLEKTCYLHQKRVISMSENDPLANKDAIANQWAYLNALKMAKNMVTVLVDDEVKRFDQESKGAKQ